MKPKLLDLFCGAGGCSEGYHRAGFDVVGIDCKPQRRYPFPFMRDDALNTVRLLLAGGSVVTECGQELPLVAFDAIHASPPCQGYSQTRFVVSTKKKSYPRLLDVTYRLLESSGKPWVIENVSGSPLNGIMLCGTMFGLAVRRHRIFDASFMLYEYGRYCSHQVTDYGVYAGKVTKLGTKAVAYTASSGRTHYRPEIAQASHASEAMGIGWMTLKEMCQAIPPCYTEFVGRQLIAAVLK